MARQPVLKFSDKAISTFGRDLSQVLGELESQITSILSGATTGGEIDATIILNSKPAMLQALTDSGYTALAQEHVNKYPGLASDIKSYLSGLSNFPEPILTEASAATFQGLARIDLEQFAKIGEQATDELRLSLYRQAVGNQPFNIMVDTVKQATVGLDGKGSPMANHAYAHANTAVLKFQGEVIREVGEELGADRWEVVGPLDDKTREACRNALANRVRTKKQWQEAGYFGGAPGGWSCRHQLFPVFN